MDLSTIQYCRHVKCDSLIGPYTLELLPTPMTIADLKREWELNDNKYFAKILNILLIYLCVGANLAAKEGNHFVDNVSLAPSEFCCR